MTSTSVASPSPAAPSADDHALRAEFDRHASYLTGLPPTPYQIGKYVDFHERRTLEPASDFDALLFRISHLGWLGLVLADAYSGTLYRVSLVRVKLMLALAILECSEPSYRVIDAPDPGAAGVFVTMGLRVGRAFVALVVAAALIAPLHVLYALAGRARRTKNLVKA
jgi:hypothetical protein